MSSYKMKTPFRAIVRNSNVIARSALGSWVTDIKGKSYLDMTSGIGALSTGHCHPTVVSRVTQQVGKLVHAQMNCLRSHVEQEELLKRLDSVFPENLNTVFFTNSGSEAIDNAVKLARRSTGRPNVISFLGGFHGRTIGGMSLGGSKATCRSGFQPLMSGVFHIPYPSDKKSDADAACQALDDILCLATAPEETAAIFLEPVLGEGGLIGAHPTFGKHLRDVCDRHGILWVSDEIQTGMGRTGTGWGYERFGKVKPDIITFGKGVASGFPMGGVAASEKLFEAVHPNGLGGTFNGNAISTAAANATLEVFENENITLNVDGKGKRLVSGILTLRNRHVKEVRSYGLMIAVELDLEYPTFRKMVESASYHGLLVLTTGTVTTLRLLPPLVITNAEIDEAVVRLGSMLDSIPQL